MVETSLKENIDQYIGQVCCMSAQDRDHFGILQAQPEDVYVIPPFGFKLDNISEIRKIEVAPEINAVRAVIVLK